MPRSCRYNGITRKQSWYGGCRYSDRSKVPLCLTLPPHPVRSTDAVPHPKGFALFSLILREIHSSLSKRNRHVLNCVLASIIRHFQLVFSHFFYT